MRLRVGSLIFRFRTQCKTYVKERRFCNIRNVGFAILGKQYASACKYSDGKLSLATGIDRYLAFKSIRTYVSNVGFALKRKHYASVCEYSYSRFDAKPTLRTNWFTQRFRKDAKPPHVSNTVSTTCWAKNFLGSTANYLQAGSCKGSGLRAWYSACNVDKCCTSGPCL
jgi:hypothetical protein